MENIYSAKTLDEAKEKAYKDFAAKYSGSDFDKDEIQFQILEQPVKKFFGYKGEYKIRAVLEKTTDNILDDIDLFPELAPTKHILDDDEIDRKEEAAEEKEMQKQTQAAAAPEKKKKENFSGRPKQQPPVKPVPPSVQQTDPQTSEAEAEKKEAVLPSVNDAKVLRAIEFLEKVIAKLGVENFKIVPIQKEDVVVLDIVGEKLGVVIGRRGETLDSLQYLAILSGNRGGEPYSRISVDCNGYRDKRRQTLENLAKSTAQKVLKQGRRVTLEPMNPYERRIIHSTISDIEGVFSNSIGEEPFRKVVISAVNAKPYNSRKTRGAGAGIGRNRNTGSAGRHSYKQSGGYSTTFEREYKENFSKDGKRQNESGQKDDLLQAAAVEAEKNLHLFEKIEL